MNQIWLLETKPSDVSVHERQAFFFNLDDNPSIETEGCSIDVEIAYPVDGNFYIDLKALERARLREDGIGRLGLFGIVQNVPEDEKGPAKHVPSIFTEATLKDSAPLYSAADGSLVTWALDLPREVDADLAGRPVGASEQLCRFKMSLPTLHPTLYPMTILPNLQIFGDDLPRLLEVLCSFPSNPQTVANFVNMALDQTTRESIFEVGLSIHVPSIAPSTRLRLTRLAIEWPSGGNGQDVTLMRISAENKREDIQAGCFDPAAEMVSFPMLEAGKEDLFAVTGEPELKLRLRIQNQSVLSSMSPLKGELEVKLDRLISGVQPFMSDVTGRIALGFGRSLEALPRTVNIKEATILRGRFRIDLRSLFRNRLVAQHVRLQFPGRRFSEKDQLRQLKTILRNYKFSDNETIELKNPDKYLLYGKNTLSGREQFIVFNVAATRRKVTREVQGAQSGAIETRQDEVDDIVLDLAMVGHDHRALADTLTEIRRDVVSVLGTVRG